jgi:hypothetical protein
MEVIMRLSSSLRTAILAATAALLSAGAQAGPMPTNVAAMKSMVDQNTTEVRWGGGWRGGGFGYRGVGFRGGGWGYRGGYGYRGGGWGYRGLGYGLAAGALVGGAIASSAYYGGGYYGDSYAAAPYGYGGGYGYGYGGGSNCPPYGGYARYYGW